LTEWIARVLNEEDIIPTYDELSNYRGARDLDFWIFGAHTFSRQWLVLGISKRMQHRRACPTLLW
jgi:hypothetical protein